MNVVTMLPTAFLLSRGLPGLSKFLIFSGESELTTTRATCLGFLQGRQVSLSLLAPLLVTRAVLGEWKSWKCLGIRDLAMVVPQTGQGEAVVEGLSGGSRTGRRRAPLLSRRGLVGDDLLLRVCRPVEQAPEGPAGCWGPGVDWQEVGVFLTLWTVLRCL